MTGRFVAALTVCAALCGRHAAAQVSVQGGGSVATPAAAPPQTYLPAPAYAPMPLTPPRTDLEMTWLYVTSAAYGVGMGVWVSTELGLEDPATFLIAPALLGVGAPVGAFFLDRPNLRRGVPSAIAAGMMIGAGEGVGIWGYQFVTADEEDAWGFRGLARAEALGATLGAVGGYALGYFQSPSPKSSLLATSSVFWGTAIGSMFGYGTSAADTGYGLSNDSAALGGLIGFNLGLGAAAAVSTVYIPSYRSLEAMWLGAGIGAAASLPIYLFYAGDGGPPAKRGLIFSGTATALGIAAGAVFTLDSSDVASSSTRPAFARLYGVTPAFFRNGAGVNLVGELE